MTNMLPTDEAERQARILKAISDCHRLQILHILKESDGTITVEQIVEKLPIVQPTTSYHLSRLAGVGILKYKRQATYVYYEIDKEALAQVYNFLGQLMPVATTADAA